MNNTNLIGRMETLSVDFKAQFDTPPNIPLVWSICDDWLCLDGIKLYPVSEIAPEGESVWTTSICLPLKRRGRLDIFIDWPYGTNDAKICLVREDRILYTDDDFLDEDESMEDIEHELNLPPKDNEEAMQTLTKGV